MTNKLSIGTVTYGDRWLYFATLHRSLRENTDLDEIDWTWHIVLNNVSPDALSYFKRLDEEFPDKFHIYESEVNVGIGPAMDILKEEIGKGLYLFLEDDWVCLPAEYTNISRKWLLESMEAVSSGKADMLYFRRYVDIWDAKKHFWNRKIQEYQITPEPRDLYLSGIRFMRLIPTHWNNPHMIDLDTKYDIYPLVRNKEEGFVETKDSPGWGSTEGESSARIQNTNIKCFYAFNGLFAHYDYLKYHYNVEGTKFVYDHPFDNNPYNYISSQGL